MKATVTVMLKPGVLDPQGKAIGHALHTLGFAAVGEVRAGKVIELELAESDPERARAAAEEMARKLLANTVIESFRVWWMRSRNRSEFCPLPLAGGGWGEGAAPRSCRPLPPTPSRKGRGRFLACGAVGCYGPP